MTESGRTSAASHSSTGSRLLLAVLSLTVFTLLAEGGLSLLAGRSFADLWAGPRSAREWLAPTERDRWLAAAQNPGPWRVHEDPLVGFCLRTDSEVEVFGVQVRTDGLGLRARPEAEGTGASPGEGAEVEPLRIHILGDSVAFGWGVEDDETLAHRLELHLNAVRPPGSRPVVCRTVAIPGWNHRNAVHFLLDHWDELPADIVLYMPIDNDLANGYGVAETGHRREMPDIASEDPWLTVSSDQAHFVVLDLINRLEEKGDTSARSVEELGPEVLEADLSAESSRRLDDNAADIRMLAGLMTARGSQMLLLQYSEQRYLWHLWSRLAADGGAPLPVVPLLDKAEGRFTLPTNPHPNAVTLDTFALWCAASLLEQGLVPGGQDAIARLPAVPGDYAEHRAQVLDPAGWHERSDANRTEDRTLLLSRVDSATGEGMRQVYGGLQAGRVAARTVLALLASPGDNPELVIRVAPLEGRPDLLPLRVQVECDGTLLGSLLVEEGGPTVARFSLPADLAESAEEHEIRLIAERDVVTRYAGRVRLASYRLLSLELRELP